MTNLISSRRAFLTGAITALVLPTGAFAAVNNEPLSETYMVFRKREAGGITARFSELWGSLVDKLPDFRDVKEVLPDWLQNLIPVTLVDKGGTTVSVGPMSTTKPMVIHLALQKIIDQGLSPNTPVTFTDAINAVKPIHLGFHQGETILLKEMVCLAFMNSCNQCATMLAAKFDISVADLNKEARSFGLKNTRFVSVDGWPVTTNGVRDPGSITAEDAGKMAISIDTRWMGNDLYESLMRETFVLSPATSALLIRKNRVPKVAEVNEDKLVLNHHSAIHYVPQGCIPFKTGTGIMEEEARRNFIFIKRASATEDAQVGVLLGCRKELTGRYATALMQEGRAKVTGAVPAIEAPRPA